MTWIVGFTGPGTAPTAADNNNFGLYQGATLIATATVDAVNNGDRVLRAAARVGVRRVGHRRCR